MEVAGPGGHVSTTTRTGHDIESIEDVSVPAAGGYRAEVFLRDAAGNESPTSAAAVDLEFDDTVPTKAEPEIANGWLSRRDLGGGYVQSWRSRGFEIAIGYIGLPGSREHQS